MKRKPLGWIRDGACITCTSHCLNDDGYPQIRRNGKTLKLHRLILFRRHKGQPSSVHCRHTCDNRRCINPDHIIPGTNTDNVRDRHLRGRTAHGESKSSTKLKIEDVKAIKHLLGDGYLSFEKIGKIYGVSDSAINDIKTGRSWSHVKVQEATAILI